jgi:serine/threonine-protein kinase HipA
MDVAGEAARPGDRDMLRVAGRCGIDPRKARPIIGQVRGVVGRWPDFAAEAGVPGEPAQQIRQLLAQRVG